RLSASPTFPYTTLFRSVDESRHGREQPALAAGVQGVAGAGGGSEPSGVVGNRPGHEDRPRCQRELLLVGEHYGAAGGVIDRAGQDRKSTRLNSSHQITS